MRFARFSLGLLAAAVLAHGNAFGWPPDAAPEFNFSNDELYRAWARQPDRGDTSNSVSEAYRERMAKAVAASCPECQITPGQDRYGVKKYRVTYPSGWWFEITLDPSVVEIVARPATSAEFRALEGSIQRDVFGVASALGLKPALAGHVNLGVAETFGNDTRLFRDFVVDLMNHPGVMKRALHENESFNAPHVEDLAEAQSRAFKALVDGSDFSTMPLKEFASRLVREVYYATTWDAPAAGEPPIKYHALNVTSIVAEGDSWPRLEIRAAREQGSISEFLLVLELFEARIEFLRRQQTSPTYTATRESNRQTRSSDEAAVREFHKYVTETGLAWERFSVLLPAPLARLARELGPTLATGPSSCNSVRAAAAVQGI